MNPIKRWEEVWAIVERAKEEEKQVDKIKKEFTKQFADFLETEGIEYGLNNTTFYTSTATVKFPTHDEAWGFIERFFAAFGEKKVQKKLQTWNTDELKWYWEISIDVDDREIFYLYVTPAEPDESCKPKIVTSINKSWVCEREG